MFFNHLKIKLDNYLKNYLPYISKLGIFDGPKLAKALFPKNSNKDILEVKMKDYKHPIFLRNNSSDISNFHEIFFNIEFPLPNNLNPKFIIDAGANFGMYSILFAKLNIKNQVYSIEPFKEYNKIILHNSKLNNLKNIKIINKVLSDKIAKYKLNKNLGNTSASITRKFNKASYIGVKSITIDRLVKTNKIKKIDFIKLDVEGAELMALQGGKKSIKNFKPKIALECSSKKEFYEINKFLMEFNYKPFSFDKKKIILLCKLVLVNFIKIYFFLIKNTFI